jgi:DtxR family Mn-dependent transcriptional regulator
MPKFGTRVRPTSPVQEDYLKALHRLSAGDRTVLVPNSQLAEELRVSPGSVSEMLGKLATLNLVVHYPYRGASLTQGGSKIAIEMVRHHRLIETYLVAALGYGWDEVHEEADRLEHSISELLEERMWQALGEPAFDPHGDPIPTPDFVVVQVETFALQEARAGSEVRIAQVSDRDSERLRALQRLGIVPGRPVRIVHESVWEAPITVEFDGVEIAIPLGLARAVRVEAAVG